MAGVATRISSAATRPCPLAFGNQRLTDDALEHERELRANLRLLVRRERVDQTRDRLRRRVRVQRRHRQVAGLGQLERGFHRFEVAQLADEHHVRVFAERGAQRHAEALRVGVQLALVDQRGLVLVQVFDRVLDRQDVRLLGQVDPIDHRGERRRLAAAGRAGDEHEAARAIGQLGEHRRQAQFLERTDLLGDQAEDRADRRPSG